MARGAKLEGLLDPGETLVCSRPVAPAGALGAQMGANFAGAAGAIVFAPPTGDDKTVPVPPKTNLLAITDARLLLIRSRVVGSAKVLASLALRDVDSLEATKATVAFGKVTVTLTAGSVLVFDLQSDRRVDEFATKANEAIGVASG